MMMIIDDDSLRDTVVESSGDVVLPTGSRNIVAYMFRMRA